MKKKMNPKHARHCYAKYTDIDEMYAMKVRMVQLAVPAHFRMLCAIFGVKTETILQDFMWCMVASGGGTNKKKQREVIQQFLLSRKYGQPEYSKKQIVQMINELTAMQLIRQRAADIDESDQDLFWKSDNMYVEQWFKHWFTITRSEESINVLNDY